MRVFMEKFFDFIYRHLTALSGESEFSYALLKAAFAVILALIVWLIIRKVISLFEKRSNKKGASQTGAQYLRFTRRVVFYGLILATGTYLINLFKIQLFQKVFYAFLIVLLAAPVKDLLVALMNFLEGNLADKTKPECD